jgi:hypothetical protein
MKNIPYKFTLAVYSCFLFVVLAACDTTPGLTVSGRLVNKEGQPVTSIKVMLGRYRNTFDQYHAFSIPSIGGVPFEGTTDKNGVFQIQSADAGEYLLLYKERTDGEETIHALTNKKGEVIIVELSETKGAAVGTITLLTYPKLPNRYLPDFLAGTFLSMSFDDFEQQIPNPEQTILTEDHIYYDATKQIQGVDKITFSFDTQTNRLDELDIWYTEDTSAYNFGEETFGIPNYQGASVDEGSIIYWHFDFGKSQVVVTASKGMLKFRLWD